MIFLDKTGTLTEGRMTLVRWFGNDSIKEQVRAVESHSSHPIARAFLKGLPGSDLKAHNVCQQVDGGITGNVEGYRLTIGSQTFIEEQGILIPDWTARHEQECMAEVLTPVYIAVGGRMEAVAGFGDKIGEDTNSAICNLKRLGWNVGILSGDHPEIVHRVASTLGIRPDNVHGGLTPEQKLQFIQEKKRKSPVVMVGDGVNDAAALAAATVGIAVHGGAEASLSAADIYLNTPGLTGIVDLIDCGRRTIRVIRRNLIISLSYNLAGVTMAASGLINPLIAAILMPLSSFTVLSLSLSQHTFQNKSCP